MFNFKHYIPILRWKAAEKEALGHVPVADKKFITPLIEFVMPSPAQNKAGEDPKSPEQMWQESVDGFKKNLPEIADQISKYWGEEPVFIDVHLLDGSIRSDALKEMLTKGQGLNLFMIPVINLIPVVDFGSDVQTREVAFSFAQKTNQGLCLRLSHTEITENTLPERIEAFLTAAAISPEKIDLLVDLQNIDEEEGKIESVLNKLPRLSEWRTFTIAGGAFPPDLSQFKSPDRYDIPRKEWGLWLKLKDKLTRKPSFSDYTIQHAIPRDLTPGANPSASIRYTLNDTWLIMKGMALRGKKSIGFKQYPAQASLLAAQPEFFGENFSYGDGYIVKMGKDVNSKETGNPKTWLRAGINHHLVCVIKQIANLS